jgi:hypothetical protein
LGNSERVQVYIYLTQRLKISKGGSDAVNRKSTDKYNGQIKRDKQRTTKRNPENQRSSNTSTGGELRCSGRVSSSCFTCGTRRVPVRRHEYHLIWKSFLTSAKVNVYIFITYGSVCFITMNEPRCIILVRWYRRCCITPQFCTVSLWHNRCLIWVFNDIWFVWNKYIYLYKIYRRIRFFSQILELNLHKSLNNDTN